MTAGGKKTYPRSLSPARHMLRCRFVHAYAACAGHAVSDQFAKRNRGFPAKRRNKKKIEEFAVAWGQPTHVGFPGAGGAAD
jgi:hypothetical protein